MNRTGAVIAAAVLAIAGTVTGILATVPSPTVSVIPSVCLSPESGPTTAPSGAVTVPAGDNSTVAMSNGSLLVGTQLPANTTFWFAPGTHTLGTGEYDQIQAGQNDVLMGAPGAILNGQGDNDYAITAPASATGVTVEFLTVEDFIPPGGNGAVNVNAESGWTVLDDTITENTPGAGLMIGTDNVVCEDVLSDNGEYGFDAYSVNDVSSLTGGPSNIVMVDDTISGNDTYDWEAKDPGCGCSGGGKFWEVDGATVEDNVVSGNLNDGLWADTNDDSFTFSGNTFTDNASIALEYEISYNASITDNTFTDNGWTVGPTNPGFPTGAIYLSESGGDSRVANSVGSAITVSGNTFVDNWSGVILWENSNRFCGSPDNTSSDDCTLVDPSVANLSTCDETNLENATPSGNPDYYDLCRWKTQNVSVTDNTFDLTQANVTGCTSANACGQNGIFSEYCSNSSNGIGWSPYCGDSGFAISDAITTAQNNLFSDNTYSGPWTFDYGTQATDSTFAQWQADGQDPGSTFNGTPPTTTSSTSTTSTSTSTSTTTSTTTTTTTTLANTYPGSFQLSSVVEAGAVYDCATKNYTTGKAFGAFCAHVSGTVSGSPTPFDVTYNGGLWSCVVQDWAPASHSWFDVYCSVA